MGKIELNNFVSKPLPPESASVLKKDVLRNFAKCRERHLRWNFFLNKIESFRPATLFKKRLRHRCFPVNFMKFLKAPFLQNTCGWLLLKKFNTFSLSVTKLRKREKRKYKVWPELKLILLKIKMLWRSQSTFNYWYQKMLFFLHKAMEKPYFNLHFIFHHHFWSSLF